MTKAEKEHAQRLKERYANLDILSELRKSQISEYKRRDQAKGNTKRSYQRFSNLLKTKVSAMNTAKLEELIALEQSNLYDATEHLRDESEYGTGLMSTLLWERKCKYPHPCDFKMTDKKYQKFVQLNDSFMEAYSLAKEQAKAISKLLKRRKKSNPSNPLLKEFDDFCRLDIIIRPVFYDWDELNEKRSDNKWRRKNQKLEEKYKFYEALEWAFEKIYWFEIECSQYWSSNFEHNERKKEWFDKDPDGNLGPTNWAFEWIPHDSKYYWKRRLIYIMHVLADHTFLTLEDILEIKRLEISFKIRFGEIPVKHNSSQKLNL